MHGVEADDRPPCKLYCMYTPQFEHLLTDYFLPSLKDDFDVVAVEFPQDCPSGMIWTEGWERTMLNKLKLIEHAILENWGGKVFIYSDIDITFLRPILDISLQHLGEKDFIAQQGWPRNKICAGFLVMRGNERTLRLIETAYELLRDKVCADDQAALQRVLDSWNGGGIDWGFLPSEQFPNGRRVLKHTEGYYTDDSDIELDGSIVMFHASCCIGLENKCRFLRRVERLFLDMQGLEYKL